MLLRMAGESSLLPVRPHRAQPVDPRAARADAFGFQEQQCSPVAAVFAPQVLMAEVVDVAALALIVEQAGEVGHPRALLILAVSQHRSPSLESARLLHKVSLSTRPAPG